MDFSKIFWRVGRGPRNNRLDFGANLDPGILYGDVGETTDLCWG